LETSIAVIDDGVSASTIRDIAFNKTIEDGEVRESCDFVSQYSHASICAAIIRRYAPIAKIGSIQVLGKCNRGKLTDLTSSLRWCAWNDIRLINLSIGSVQAYDIPDLRKAVNDAVTQGCIIVAACKNGHKISYPASFHNVLGVCANNSLCDSQYSINPKPNGGIEFSASAIHSIQLSETEPVIHTTEFNSYAAPVITASVFNMIYFEKCGLNVKDVRTNLFLEVDNDENESTYYNSHRISGYFNNYPNNHKVPVVLFLGRQFMTLAISIAEMFMKSNYLPILFSRIKGDCTNMSIHIENVDMLNKFCHSVANYCNADLVIAVINVNEIDRLKPDVVVVSGATDAQAKHIKDYSLILADGLTNTRVYNKIITFLENE